MLDWQAINVTLKLAFFTVLVLLMVGMPLAWWLSRTKTKGKVVIEAVTALPLVLPPTVLGFYLLMLLGAQGPLGGAWTSITGQPLAFTFMGLLIASCIYSLPFVVQPLQAAFEGLNRNTLEASWTLGASRTRTFIKIVVPQVRRGLITAIVLGFAHTLGEFGVVLMVGGNIPGETKVISIAIYEHVETLEYASAHRMAGLLLIFSFLVLFTVYLLNRRWQVGLRA
jgi:molybdate transport system permease protein